MIRATLGIVTIVVAGTMVIVDYPISAETVIPVNQPINWQGKHLGTVESIALSEQGMQVSAAFSRDIPRHIDNYLGGKGDLEGDSWSTRIYWRGGTSIRHGGSTIGLQSNVTWDQWTKIDVFVGEIKTRLFETTHAVDWELEIPFPTELSNLRLQARIVNIRDFPDELEDLLELRASREIDIPLPTSCGKCTCDELTKALGAKVMRVNFYDSNPIRIEIHLSISLDFSNARKCIS